jgi:DNA-binding NarL/FixJ family response regulator
MMPESNRTMGTPLTLQQAKVFDLMCDGLSNRDIAARLRVVEGTVKLHVSAVLRAHKAKSRLQAVVSAYRAALAALAKAGG